MHSIFFSSLSFFRLPYDTSVIFIWIHQRFFHSFSKGQTVMTRTFLLIYWWWTLKRLRFQNNLVWIQNKQKFILFHEKLILFCARIITVSNSIKFHLSRWCFISFESWSQRDKAKLLPVYFYPLDKFPLFNEQISSTSFPRCQTFFPSFPLDTQ